jgi:uncharacterized membrane protein HdeD (DUF308 family)
MKKYLAPRLLITTAIAWIVIGTLALTSDHNTYLSAIQFAGFALLFDSLVLVAVAYTCDAAVIERKWIIAEAAVSGLFSGLLLLDPVFSFFVFPFLVTPWIVAKGLLTMIAALALKKSVHGWSGDLTGGFLLILCGLFISYHPIDNIYGINILIGAIGWTTGLLYLYDAYRFGKINPTFHKGPLGKTHA